MINKGDILSPTPGQFSFPTVRIHEITCTLRAPEGLWPFHRKSLNVPVDGYQPENC
jgi:hypothetical protein